MSTLTRSDTFTRAIAAAREEAATVPLREYDTDEETIRGVPREIVAEAVVDTSMFDSLTEFELDLSLSPTSSPTASTSELPPSTPSPPLSPILSRTFSFSSRREAPPSLTWRKLSSSPVVANSSAGTRGSWPLVRYTGRGTPIDQRRRLEWAGVPSDAVGEDGYLFSEAVRSTSLDSALPPSERPVSSDWDHVSQPTNSDDHGNPNGQELSIHEPPPELGPLGLERNSVDHCDEWEGIMRSVLASSSEPQLPPMEREETPIEPLPNPEVVSPPDETPPIALPINFTIMSKEQVEALNSGLESELGLNSALDLDLGQRSGAGPDWAAPKPTSIRSRCSSPSVYSESQIAIQPQSPSIAISDRSDRHSTTSTTAEGGRTISNVKQPCSRPWWRKFFSRFRSIQTRVSIQKDRF